ncbi:MAG TPA: hypothetical protein VKB93_06910 [Thermoanaerobaculia bacterium]|nr:hypothetical protein [Thermoanaerobaculia bacterium]
MQNKRNSLIVAAALAAALSGCSGELANNSSPVELVVTNTQTISRIDLAGGAGCTGTVGAINMTVIPKNGSAIGDFLQVRVTRYRVSYQRTDGGSQVPQSFVRATDQLLSVGSSASPLSNLVVLETDAINQSPFAALLPQNGGRDPVTGRPVVQMDVIVEIFGETLSGDRVYDATRFPLDFCYQCNGCQ